MSIVLVQNMALIVVSDIVCCKPKSVLLVRTWFFMLYAKVCDLNTEISPGIQTWIYMFSVTSFVVK